MKTLPPRSMHKPRRLPSRRAPHGFALIAILLIVGMIAVIGLAMASAGILQERMAGASRDQQVALQSAELALRDAEAALEADANATSGFTEACTNGRCLLLSERATAALSQPRWRTIDWATQSIAYGSATGAPPIKGPQDAVLSQQPRYFIELLPTLPAQPGSSNCAGVGCSPNGDLPARAFRITARGFGVRSTTAVILQSVYVKT